MIIKRVCSYKLHIFFMKIRRIGIYVIMDYFINKFFDWINLMSNVNGGRINLI